MISKFIGGITIIGFCALMAHACAGFIAGPDVPDEEDRTLTVADR
jgi:hypothetical protein